MKETITLRFLIWQEGSSWVAVDVDHYISAQADRFEDLGYQIEHAIFGHIVAAEIEGIEPFRSIMRSETEYRDRFERSKRFDLSLPKFEGISKGPTPAIEARQYAYA